ncbi:MAG: PAS domain S-box protein [Aestuariivirga sp.]
MTPSQFESERRSRLAAEAALRIVSERLEKAEEAAGALIYDWDINTRKIWRSPGLTRVLGWQSEEIDPTVEGWAELQHPNDRERLKTLQVPGFLQADDNYVMEYRLRHKDGHYIWVLDSGRVFRDESGAILRQTGVIIDISARKKVAETLSRQTDLIELSFEPIFVWHPEKGIVEWNKGAEQLYGYSRAEALGQISHKLLQTVRPIEIADFMKLLKTVRSWTGEVQKRAKDGRQVFVETRYQVIETDGELLVLETNHDITERKRAEAETARMAAVASASQDPLFGLTLEGQIEAWNPAAERLFGYSASEAIGQHVSMIAGPSGQQEQRDYLARARAGESVGPFNSQRIRKDGTLVDVAIAVGPVKAPDGSVIAVSVTMHDISERKEWEARQRLMTRELAHRVKNSFAVLQAILRSTLKTTSNPQDFAAKFSGRLHSLAAAQDILTDNNWKGAELGSLARHLLSTYIVNEDTRLAISGPEINLPPDYAVPFGLIFNELATNALKHGALSVPGGKIDLSWRVEGKTGAGSNLILTWRERGGPKITSLEPRGFGSTLIERSLAGAKVERLFDADGLICTVSLTLNLLGRIKPRRRQNRKAENRPGA